ncbi:MAG: DUF3105 domain-containing protein [Myxococcota bacterium]
MTFRDVLVLSAVACSHDPVELGDSGRSPSTDPSTSVPDSVDPTAPIASTSVACDACGGDCVLDTLSYAYRYHDEADIDYSDPPPAGGPHDPCWAAFGVHDEPVPDDNWVHNLEHGAVVLLSDCTDCDADRAALAEIATDRPFVLVTPYSGMPKPFAAVAWGVRMLTGCVDPEAIVAFHDAHVDQGPESLAAGPPDDCM